MTAITFTARKIADASKARSQCAIIPLFSDKKPGGAARLLDKASAGAIGAALALGDFSGKAGQSLLLPVSGNSKRLLLVGAGPADKFDRKAGRELVSSMIQALNKTSARDATLHCGGLNLSSADADILLEQLGRSFTAASYRYTETVSKPKPAMKLARLTVNTEGCLTAGAAQKALDRGRCTGLGINQARNLANLPGNICTPSYLALQARKLGRAIAKLKVSVLEEIKM